jgi:hypothetical protein
MRITATLGAVVLFAAAGWAQNAAAPAGDICRIYFVKPKPGMDQQLEAGRKKHMQFHKSRNDSWTWSTYLVETGMNTGTYVTSTCGHQWADFDDWEKRLGQADTADANANMGPHQGEAWNSFYRYRADLSLGSPGQPLPLSAVYIYKLKFGKSDDFAAAVKKINDALQKANWPYKGAWLQLVNGGEAPMFVLVSERKGWADFAMPPKSLQQIVEEAYGKDQADALWKSVDACVAQAFSEAASYRPDLSYVPGK